MSLATVYKTVDILKSRLNTGIKVGEGGLRYDANIKPHSHIFVKYAAKLMTLSNILLMNCRTAFIRKS